MATGVNNPSGPRKFLTADDLRDRLEQTGKGVLDLSANEALTPAAADLVDQMGLVIRRLADSAPLYVPTVKVAPPIKQAVKTLTTGTKPTGRATVGAVGLAISDPDTQVESLLGSLRYDGTTFVDCSKTECWILNTEYLAEQMVYGPLTAGVVIAPFATDVMVVAGKMRGIRPVQGTSDDAVAAAVRHYDSGFGQMRAMIRTFTAARTPLPVADIMKAIDRHEKA
jgi:hypothetical protein